MKRLIDDAKAGDAAALTQLIDAHKTFAFNIAFDIVKDAEDAKDVVQQSFLKVLEKLPTFRNESKFSTWLYRIVFNESLRFKNERSKLQEIKASNETVKHLEEYGKGIEYDANSATEALERLVDKEKLVLGLFYLSGKTIDEIRQITNFSKSNIKVLLHRGRIHLRKKLLINDD